jgi:hypothetical protein
MLEIGCCEYSPRFHLNRAVSIWIQYPLIGCQYALRLAARGRFPLHITGAGHTAAKTSRSGLRLKKHWIYTEPKFEDKIEAHEKQRIENGFSTWDWWNFNTFLCEIILQALKRFRSSEASGYPAHLTIEEWHKELDFMIEWFNKFIMDEIYILGDKELTDSNVENWNKAKHKFAEHLDNLWD